MLPPPLAAVPVVPVSPMQDVADRWRGRSATWTRDAPDSSGDRLPRVDPEASEPCSGPAAIMLGGCYAWPLPLEATCASEARCAFREAAQALGMPDDLVYDGMTMASELAANTLHAQANVEFDGVAKWPVAGGPELWLYLRRAGGRWELVCKVFDSVTGWKGGERPESGHADAEAISGRGLQVVAGLSGGRWGFHLTRSRLGGWKVPGKAVWFALSVPQSGVPGRLRSVRLSPCQAARRLESMLAGRGVGTHVLRIDERGSGMSVLSVRCGLTVWCAPGQIWWQTGTGSYERRPVADLEEATELLVRRCEEMDASAAG